jgi:hypothetical protein
MSSLLPWVRAGALTIAIAIAAGSMAPMVAEATTLAPLSVEQMTDASTYIVRGTVTQTWTDADSQGWVWSHARVAISDVLKGPDSPSEIVVSQPGGSYQDKFTEAEGAARFTDTEEVLLFLDTIHGGRDYAPVAMFLGKYTIKRVPHETRYAALRYTAPYTKTYDGRFLPVPAPEKREYVDDILTRVNARLDQGWDGKPIPGATAEHLQQINTAVVRHR